MTHQTTLDLAREERDRIIEGHREDIPEVLDEIDRRLKAMARAGDGTVTTDDAHEVWEGMLDEPGWRGPDIDRRKFGGLWRDGWINTGRYVPSRRPENHARRVPVWRLEETQEQGG